MKCVEKLIILCVFSFFFLSSCNKEKSKYWTEVNIHCVNPHTSKAADSIFFAIRGTKNTWPNPFDYHGNFYPVDGHLSYSFKAKKNYNYTLYYPISNYHNLGEKTPVIKKGEENNFTFPMVRFGYLQVFTENLDCEWKDSLNWKVTFIDDSDYPVIDHYWTKTWDGCYGNETAVNKSVPSGYYRFEWKLKEVSGVSSSGKETLWVPENDTTLYEFKY